jgi:hypothetical protein
MEEDDDEREDLYIDSEYGNRRLREYKALSILIEKKQQQSQQQKKQQRAIQNEYAIFLYESALDLFDPFRLGQISEEQCMAALCLIYKEQRFAASSLNDYGELHQSLRSVVEVIFWIVMLIFLQAFLQINLISYFLPFITLSLTLSFALGPLIGNLFLAMTFVFFMIPFEVGNKIYIGSDPAHRIVGFVRSVSLLYTTINTTTNELVSQSINK